MDKAACWATVHGIAESDMTWQPANNIPNEVELLPPQPACTVTTLAQTTVPTVPSPGLPAYPLDTTARSPDSGSDAFKMGT